MSAKPYVRYRNNIQGREYFLAMSIHKITKIKSTSDIKSMAVR